MLSVAPSFELGCHLHHAASAPLLWRTPGSVAVASRAVVTPGREYYLSLPIQIVYLGPGQGQALPFGVFEGPEPKVVGNFNTGASGDSPRKRAFLCQLPDTIVSYLTQNWYRN